MQFSSKACKDGPYGFIYHLQTKQKIEFQYVGE